MFLKSRLLVATAIVLGSASFAAAQVDSDQMMSYQRSGPVLSSAGPNYDGRFDEDQQTNYGPAGYSALAQAPQTERTTAPSGGDGRFDENSQMNYGPIAR